MPCGFKEREKMFLMESFSGKQSASRRETFTCISWDREVGIFLKKATVLSLPGDSKGWVQTLQDRAMCWDPPASGRVLTSVSAGKTPPLPSPGMLCPAGGAPENRSETLGSILFTNHLQLPCGKAASQGGAGPWCLVQRMEDGEEKMCGQ